MEGAEVVAGLTRNGDPSPAPMDQHAVAGLDETACLVGEAFVTTQVLIRLSQQTRRVLADQQVAGGARDVRGVVLSALDPYQ